MSNTTSDARPDLPNPATAPELFESILPRRVFAFVIDFVLLTILSGVLFLVGVIFGVLTFGIGLIALPLVVPFAILGYYALTLGSTARATIGMRAMDIVLTPTRGQPLDGWKILVHPLVFWVTCWIAWPVSLAIALFTPRREMVHDLVTGTLMVRRSPMVRHWRRVGA
ncbi:MAG: RDD family protein [Alphaproteobacteria bacterium]|nr:RDD family protein [Alphaproteobacteria bacterium]